MAFHDDASCDVESEAGAFANVFGGVEGLERASGNFRRHSRAGVDHLDDDIILFGPGGETERAGAAHGVEGVVDEVGPYLVELAGVGFDRWDAGAVIAQHRDTGRDLMREHHYGAFKAVRHVDALHRGAVHLRVRFDGGNQS